MNRVTTKYLSIHLLKICLLLTLLQVNSQYVDQDAVLSVINHNDTTIDVVNFESNTVVESDSNNIFLANGVVGGRYASFGGYPFYASILVFNIKKNMWEPICGGALIHSNWVLTAAHCVVAGYKYAVEIGRYAYNSGNGGQYLEKRRAEILCTNPSFDKMKVMQDFGLLYFEEPSTITPANLDYGQIEYKDFYPFVILGFGSTESSGKGPFPEFLQEGDVYYVNNDQCGSEWSEYIDSSVLCSSSHGSGDSCKGDSGGPLIINDGTEYQDYLAGIVSYGPVPCDGSVPVLYGRVAYAKDWIERVIYKTGDTSKCGAPLTFGRRRELLRSYQQMTGFQNFDGSFGDFFDRHNE